MDLELEFRFSSLSAILRLSCDVRVVTVGGNGLYKREIKESHCFVESVEDKLTQFMWRVYMILGFGCVGGGGGGGGYLYM